MTTKGAPGGERVRWMPRGVNKKPKPCSAPRPPQTPPWVEQLLKGQEDLKQTLVQTVGRVDAIEGWVQRTPMQMKPTPTAPVQSRWYRCEDCGDRFESLPIRPGSSMKCPECAQPGMKVVRCTSCKLGGIAKIIKVDPKSKNLLCKRCRTCAICGEEPRGLEVCTKCQVEGEKTCDQCLRLPMRGSAFCAECDEAWRNKARPPAAAYQNMEPIADQESFVLPDEIPQNLPELGQYQERVAAVDIMSQISTKGFADARMG